MRVDGKRVRLWLEQTQAGVLTPLELFPRLARALPWAWVGVPVGPSDLDWKSVLFTGREVARASVRGEAAAVERVDPLRVLKGFLRGGRERLVLDPGMPSRLELSRPLVRLLFREYALLAMERRGGAWVLTRENRILALEMYNRAPYVPLYLTRADGIPQRGEVLAFRTLAEIRQGCLEAATDRVLMHAGHPEQLPLHRRHLARAEGRADSGPLARLEQGLARNLGAEAISRLLSDLDFVWAPVLVGEEVVPVRPEGDVIDLFTSAGHAEGFLFSPASVAGDAVRPRLVPAQPLLQRLVLHRTPVVINAGWVYQWQIHTGRLRPGLPRDGELAVEPAVEEGVVVSGGFGGPFSAGTD